LAWIRFPVFFNFAWAWASFSIVLISVRIYVVKGRKEVHNMTHWGFPLQAFVVLFFFFFGVVFRTRGPLYHGRAGKKSAERTRLRFKYSFCLHSPVHRYRCSIYALLS